MIIVLHVIVDIAHLFCPLFHHTIMSHSNDYILNNIQYQGHMETLYCVVTKVVTKTVDAILFHLYLVHYNGIS